MAKACSQRGLNNWQIQISEVLEFMRVPMRGVFSLAILCTVLTSAVALSAQTTDISSTPSSLSFLNTYVGKASGSKVLTINNLTTSGQIIITSIAFTCPGFGISSGIAPFTLGQTQKIT